MNLHEVCLFLLKEIRIRRKTVTAADEISLLKSLMPARIRGEFPVLFGITGCNENLLKAFMVKNSSANTSLMAVSVYYQTHADQIELLLNNCEKYLENEKTAIQEKYFYSACQKWRKSLHLTPGSAFECFLLEAEARGSYLLKEHLCFLLLSAMSHDNEMLSLMYRALLEHREQVANTEKQKPVKELLYTYCTLYNMAANLANSSKRLQVEPLAGASFRALAVDNEDTLEKAGNRKPSSPKKTPSLRSADRKKYKPSEEVLSYLSELSEVDNRYYEHRDSLSGTSRTSLDSIAHTFYLLGERYSHGDQEVKEDELSTLRSKIVDLIEKICS